MKFAITKMLEKLLAGAALGAALWLGQTTVQAQPPDPTFDWHQDVKDTKKRVEEAKEKREWHKRLNLRADGETEDRIDEGGTRVIDPESTMEGGTAIVVERGTVIINSNIRGVEGRGKGKIKLLGQGALLVIEADADVDVEAIEVAWGAEVVINTGDGANNPNRRLKVSGWENNGRIVIEGKGRLKAEGALNNRGRLFLANPGASERDPHDPLPPLTITNYGIITTAVNVIDPLVRDPNIGVLDANLTNVPGSEIEVRVPRGPNNNGMANMSGNNAVRNRDPRPGGDPAPSGGSAYLTINGSLGASSTTMTVNINSSYYGQYAINLPIAINGPTLVVNTNGGYNPDNDLKFFIIKASSINALSSGFGNQSYGPAGYSYSHSIQTVDRTCYLDTRECYVIQNVTPTP